MADASNFSGYWTGSLSGTNQGGFALELVQDGVNVSGTAKINEPALGVYEYKASGKAENGHLRLSMIPSRNDGGLQLGKVTVAVTLDGENGLSGRWESTIGTAGIFRAERFVQGN